MGDGVYLSCQDLVPKSGLSVPVIVIQLRAVGV